MFADSDWVDDPERFFGHVTVKVDPGDEEDYTPRTQSEKNGDADDDDDSISDVSGIDDDDDEVPFGPSRTVGGEPGQSKSLELLRRGSYHGGDNQLGTQSIEIQLLKVIHHACRTLC